MSLFFVFLFKFMLFIITNITRLSFRSVYREILFLSLVALGRENIDNGK